eukprot:g2567.t1
MTTTTSKYIAVVGSVCIDNFVEIPRLPKQGETLPSLHPRSTTILPGGKGANQAAGVSSLGSKSYFVGRIGDDADADAIESALSSKGVDIAATERNKTGAPSGKAFIFLEPSGANSIIIVQGTNIEGWEAPYFDKNVRKLIENASALMLQREIPDDVNLEAAKIARANDVPVLLDVGGSDATVDSRLAPLVSIIWPNETELSNITEGMPTDTEEEVLAAVERLREQGMSDALITLGGRGSLFVSADDPKSITRGECFDVGDAVKDTTGAGDCFRAAYATARFCDGHDVAYSLRFASASSALLVQRMGAMSAPKRTEVEGFLQSRGGRDEEG